MSRNTSLSVLRTALLPTPSLLVHMQAAFINLPSMNLLNIFFPLLLQVKERSLCMSLITALGLSSFPFGLYANFSLSDLYLNPYSLRSISQYFYRERNAKSVSQLLLAAAGSSLEVYILPNVLHLIRFTQFSQPISSHIQFLSLQSIHSNNSHLPLF